MIYRRDLPHCFINSLFQLKVCPFLEVKGMEMPRAIVKGVVLHYLNIATLGCNR